MVTMEEYGIMQAADHPLTRPQQAVVLISDTTPACTFASLAKLSKYSTKRLSLMRHCRVLFFAMRRQKRQELDETT
jgi:hypothetical protein